MEQKELIIEALNRAIRVYKSNNHQPLWGDIVTDFNVDNTKVGTYLTRPPGCISGNLLRKYLVRKKWI